MSAVAFPDPNTGTGPGTGPTADPSDERTGPEDPFATELALSASEPAAELNRQGLLVAADVHVGRRLGEIAGVDDPVVLLAVALTVAATRSGHSFLALDEAAPGLPPGGELITRLRAVPRLIATDPTQRAPVRLEGARLYLDRYWREERRLAAALLARNRMRTEVGDLAGLGDRIARLVLGPDADDQRLALAVAMLRDLTVLAGGPGTGKTTTVAWIVALTLQHARATGRPEPLIALCAPTGKAAARLQEAVATGAHTRLPADPSGAPGPRLTAIPGSSSVAASTIHRLLGWLPDGRFRHDARNRLPHDLVIVDETSMVPLSMMVRLAEAVRDDAQLVLVGDPDQLAAIEVGAVLRDIVGPAGTGPRFGQGMRGALERVTGTPVSGAAQARGFGDGIVVLRHGHRSVPAIGRLAEAIRRGDGDDVMAELRTAPSPQVSERRELTLFDAVQEQTPRESPAVVWLPRHEADLDALRGEAITALAPMAQAALAGDGSGALERLQSFRLLCAHRHGPYGVSHWGAVVQSWLREAIPSFETGAERYPGLPLLVTRNDYELQLRNGDTGVVVSGPSAGDGPVAVLDTAAGLVRLAPSRLADVEPLWAATVYRSQGSEFEVAALVLPEPDSPLLTRELLYTGITRARRRLFLIGSEESVRAAVARPAGRASGLADLLWSAAERPASD